MTKEKKTIIQLLLKSGFKKQPSGDYTHPKYGTIYDTENMDLSSVLAQSFWLGKEYMKRKAKQLLDL